MTKEIKDAVLTEREQKEKNYGNKIFIPSRIYVRTSVESHRFHYRI